MAQLLPPIPYGNFIKGVNFTDSVAVVGEGELLDSYNVTLDNIGAVTKRLGYTQTYPSVLSGGLVSNLYYWKNQNKLVAQVGAEIHIDGNAVAIKTFTTSARVGFAEFDTSLYITHPVDGLFKITSGLVVSGPIANAPAGNALCVWQNRLWSTTNNSPRLSFSEIATPDTWIPQFVDLRDKDGNPLTGIRTVSNGILAFKAESAYHVYDSNTGAYTTIDAKWGCGSSIGHEELNGRIYCISMDGIFSTDGNSPLVLHSRKFSPYFPALLNTSREDLMCAGFFQDRLYFSLPLGTNAYNSLELEVQPETGWIMPHSRAASAYATVGDGSQKFGSPAVSGRVYNGFAPVGTDDGAPISSYIQTRYLTPLGGSKFRVRRVRIAGQGSFTIKPYGDYLNVALASIPFAFVSAPVYDDPTVTYDGDDYYADTGFESFGDEYDLGVFRSLSLRIEETSSLTQISRSPGPVSEQTTIITGGWNISGIDLTAVQLGSA
jgi:hypothetical protein